MPTLPKIRKAKSPKAKAKGSALDSAQRELLERQNQIQAEIDALQLSLEQKTQGPYGSGRRGRGTVGAAAPGARFTHGATVMDPRRITAVGAPVRRPPAKRPTMLREERNAARRQTMALVVFLAAAVIYALSHLLP